MVKEQKHRLPQVVGKPVPERLRQKAGAVVG